MYADFQQWYGIDLWSLDLEREGRDLTRAAILAGQLPIDSRVNRAATPLASVTITDRLLREIEHHWRMWMWSHSEDGKKRINCPEKLPFDGEEEQHKTLVEREVAKSGAVADALGLHGLEATA